MGHIRSIIVMLAAAMSVPAYADDAPPPAFDIACDGGRFGHGATEAEARAALAAAADRGSAYAATFHFDVAKGVTTMSWYAGSGRATWRDARLNGQKIVIYDRAEPSGHGRHVFDYASMTTEAVTRQSSLDTTYLWTVSTQKCGRTTSPE